MKPSEWHTLSCFPKWKNGFTSDLCSLHTLPLALYHRWAIGQTACCRGALPVLRSQSKTNCPVSMKPTPWSSLSYWITNYSNILNELKSLAWLDARGQGADPEVKLYRMQSHSATHYQRSKAWGSSTPRSRHMVWQVGYEVDEGHWESAYLIRDGL